MQFSMLIYSLFLCCFNVGDPKSAMDLRFSFSVLFFRTQMQIFIDVNDSLHGKKSEKYFSRWEFSHFNFIFLLFYRKKSSWENKNFSIIIINCKNTSRRWNFLFYPYIFLISANETNNHWVVTLQLFDTEIAHICHAFFRWERFWFWNISTTSQNSEQKISPKTSSFLTFLLTMWNIMNVKLEATTNEMLSIIKMSWFCFLVTFRFFASRFYVVRQVN